MSGGDGLSLMCGGYMWSWEWEEQGSRDGYRLFMTCWCGLGKDGWREVVAGFIGGFWIAR